MQEQNLNNQNNAKAQGAKPYSAEEDRIFRQILNERLTAARLKELFPDRSPSAIRSRVHKMKVAAGRGIKPRERIDADGATQLMLAPDDTGIDDGAHDAFVRNCEKGSRSLAQALHKHRAMQMLA